MLSHYLIIQRRLDDEKRSYEFERMIFVDDPNRWKAMFDKDEATSIPGEEDFEGEDTLESFDKLMDSLTAGKTITADMVDDDGWL